jgi:hypothetical protein
MRSPQRNTAIFHLRVNRIGNSQRKWIPENTGRFFETDAMLGQIPSCFVRVPLKRQRHRLGSSCRRIRTCSSEDSVPECHTSQFILQSQKSIFFKAQPSTTRSTVALGKADQPSTRDHLFLTDRAQLEVFGSGERSPRRPGECVLAFANFGGRGGCSVGCPQPIFLPDPLRQRTLQPPQLSDRISNSRSRRRWCGRS